MLQIRKVVYESLSRACWMSVFDLSRDDGYQSIISAETELFDVWLFDELCDIHQIVQFLAFLWLPRTLWVYHDRRKKWWQRDREHSTNFSCFHAALSCSFWVMIVNDVINDGKLIAFFVVTVMPCCRSWSWKQIDYDKPSRISASPAVLWSVFGS